MAVVSMVVGAVDPGGATFVCKVSGGGPVRVAVATTPGMASPLFTAAQAVDAQGVAKVAITGLAPSTRYWWQTEDNGVLDPTVTGQFPTHPTVGVAASFTLGIAGDAGLSPVFPGTAGGELNASRLSNSPLWDTIRQRALAEGWAGLHLHGDWGYPDWSTGIAESVANRRTFYDNQLAQSNQAPLLREVGWSYLWDDHDFGPNNSDGTYPNKANAAQVYRERVPHHSLPDAAGIYQSWRIGRVLFVASDVRYFKSPSGDPDGPGKTMLGSDQKAWLNNLLATSDAKALVWLMPGQWIGDPAMVDTWISYQTEQAELVQMFADHGWLGRMCIIGADAHMVAIDTGGRSPGGIPVLQAAAVDATPLGNPTLYDLGGETGRDQYGTIEVTDLGGSIGVRLSGWHGTNRIITHAFGINVATPAPAAGALLRTIAGSHRATFEARVVTGQQTGEEPAGITIPILAGDVQYDATADVFATVSLTTSGYDETTGRPLFPRAAGDLLAPYGTEIFVRRGVDLGSEILWVPLGYFRIESAEQNNAPDGPIQIGGRDRMAGIVDGRLVDPRAYLPLATVGAVLADLITDVYPAAIIVWDDDSEHTALGRDLIVEEDRLAAVRALVESRGKVIYLDGSGVWRVETAPEPDDIVWDVRAGHHGVMVSVGRRASREGVYNGVVARGEGGTDSPVRALIVDTGTHSPTRWGGLFGKVPRFFESPLLTTPAQAEAAARAMLRRSIGMPYAVDFGAVVNPTLRPRQAIRITYRGNLREQHIVETLTIPLTEDTAMSGTTREQTLIIIGAGT